jgi:hypothetical protein
MSPWERCWTKGKINEEVLWKKEGKVRLAGAHGLNTS